ncbi:MAG: YceI family protein [Salibacteraceae bacterium]
MRRNVLLITAITTTIALSACGGGEKKSETAKTDTTEESTEKAEIATWKVDEATSNVRWEGGTAGAKVYSHFGTIAIQEGSVKTEGDELIAGSFSIDMTTINPKDENYSEENTPADLVGHLASDEFFAIEEYPMAMFNVKSVEDGKVIGDLTIRGKTHEEAIEIKSMNIEGDNMTAKGQLVFDRQKYDVKWEHYLQDVVLADDITLDIELNAKKS